MVINHVDLASAARHPLLKSPLSPPRPQKRSNVTFVVCVFDAHTGDVLIGDRQIVSVVNRNTSNAACPRQVDQQIASLDLYLLEIANSFDVSKIG
ncbi:hypothetical protein D3C84_422030 [compost metagenome]